MFVGTNSLGDVNALYNANGDLIVKYEYDAWGKVLAETDANGNALTGVAATWSQLNPFRYRGYYYDVETGLYYLQSRYYDAEVGRFLNSDSIIDNRSTTSINTYAYCGNNPINCSDPSGHILIGAIVGGIVGGVVGGLNATVKGESIWGGVLTGAVTGAVAGAVIDFAIQTGGVGAAVVGTFVVAAINVAGDVTNQYINYSIEKSNYIEENSSNCITNRCTTENYRLESEYVSFSEYLDRGSLVQTAVTSVAFAPVSFGTGYVVSAAFSDLGQGALNLVGEIIVSSIYEINTSLLQFAVDIIF